MPTRSLNRRHFISTTLKTGVSLTLASTLISLSACSRSHIIRPPLGLKKSPDAICALPEGFSYTIISPAGETMTDGHTVPEYHDGMGCFAGPNGSTILVRNHEIPLYFPSDPPSPAPEHAYDSAASGGTTTIWLDEDLKVVKHHLSLTGTIRNCSGGTTPWGTWISSEEAGNEGWMMGKRHGYNFEVDPLQPLKRAFPFKAMGRFNHEAVAIDPLTGIAYQTEDDTRGCFYRFIPNKPEQLDQGGVLQALKFANPNITHTSKQPLELGRSYACEWVTIDEPDPEKNTVHRQAQDKGAAIFVRGEGLSAAPDGVYFACTSGGQNKLGQFFKYTPNTNGSGGAIELVYEATADGVIEKPDNITLNQWGDLVICEDNSLDTQCLVGLTPEGKIYYIAGTTLSEWAGVCFSPDGRTLFANIQKNPGMTIAIRGPWEKLRLTA